MKAILIFSLILWSSLPGAAQRAFPDDALNLYGELKSRTILRPTVLPGLPDQVLAQALADTNNAIVLIEETLRTNDFLVVQDGDKFLRIMPRSWEDSLVGIYVSGISPIRSHTKEPSAADANDPANILPKGGINFPTVDVNEALKIYAEYRHRNILKPFTLPGIIHFKNQTPLTLEDTVYGLTVAFALNGIAAVDDGEKFIQMVPLVQANQVKTNAPQPEADSPLISPESVPQFFPFSNFQRPGPLPSAPGFPPQALSSTNSRMDHLGSYYASLVDSKYVSDENYGKWPALFKITFPVTKPELLYAIEMTLHLQGLTIAKLEDKIITIERKK
jgi:hypothetical protein